MFKALRELEAQAEWYTEATKFNVLLFQLRTPRLREGGTAVTCSEENTKTHISTPVAFLHTTMSLVFIFWVNEI